MKRIKIYQSTKMNMRTRKLLEYHVYISINIFNLFVELLRSIED